VIGKADVLEEIARLYGYDRIPATRLTDEIPVQRGNPSLEIEIRIQDILVNLGLQEVITYRLTSPEKAARLDPTGTECQQPKYVEIQNPIASDRRVMRHSLLESVLEVMEKNSRLSDRQALFEIGPVYIPLEKKELPAEPIWLAIGMSGHRHSIAWNQSQSSLLDFYDLKGIVESLLQQLHINNYRIEPAENISFHPGKCAHLFIDDKKVGTFGELHPLVKEHYDLTESPVLAAKFDVQIISSAVPAHYEVQAVPSFPPVLEDLAMILAEEISSQQVEETMQKAGGELLQAVCLFDIFRSPQIGEGKKSMAYRLTYLASDRTLTDKEVSRQRSHIIQALENELGAQIRSQ
jgi:phenylalanyl-tRNA synthetase beta chain